MSWLVIISKFSYIAILNLLPQILMNVLRILIIVMVMPVVLTPLDSTTARVTLDLKEMDVTALVCIMFIVTS